VRKVEKRAEEGLDGWMGKVGEEEYGDLKILPVP